MQLGFIASQHWSSECTDVQHTRISSKRARPCKRWRRKREDKSVACNLRRGLSLCGPEREPLDVEVGCLLYEPKPEIARSCSTCIVNFSFWTNPCHLVDMDQDAWAYVSLKRLLVNFCPACVKTFLDVFDTWLAPLAIANCKLVVHEPLHVRMLFRHSFEHLDRFVQLKRNSCSLYRVVPS